MSRSPKELRKTWDAFYGKYRSTLPEFAWGNDTPDRHVVDYVRFARPAPGAHVLDVGCGHGKNTAFLAKAGLRAVGVDFSRNAVATARRKVKDATFHCRNAARLGFPGESFDFVLDAGCLHVNPTSARKAIVAEYFRVLKPDGELFVRLFRRAPGQGSHRRPIRTVGNRQIELPVWALTRREALRLFPCARWSLRKVILDRAYGPAGCYYLYLRSKAIRRPKRDR